MEKLRAYYRTRLRLAVAIIVAIVIIYRTVVEPQVDPEFQSLARWVGSILVGALFLGAEWLIRNVLWKLEHRSLNFSGVWRGVTIYTAVEKKSLEVSAAPLPLSSEHWARIEQDCLRIKIEPTHEPFLWRSVAMDIVEDERLIYAYTVEYKDREGFPLDATGVEKMIVVEKGKSLFGMKRPTRLEGTFAHCAEGQAPVYRGQVIFRLSSEEELKASLVKSANAPSPEAEPVAGFTAHSGEERGG